MHFRLVDSDASRLMLLGLGHLDAEDAVLHAGADSVLVNARREAEASGELPDTALRKPVLGVILWLLWRALHFVDLVGLLRLLWCCVGVGFVLDASLVVDLRLLAFSDGTGLGRVLELASCRVAFGVGSLDPTADDHGLRFGEVYVDVLLAQAGQLTVQFVVVSQLADVKLRLEVRDVGARTRCSLAGVVVKVLEETEERSEGGIGVVEVARKEGSHCALLLVVVVVVVVVIVVDGRLEASLLQVS